MALLKLGAFITQASGKVGGQSIVNGSQGTYLKNIGNISKVATPRQSVQRNITAEIMSTWRTLTDIERQTWIDQAGKWQFTNRVGEVKFYNAFQTFIYCNQGLAIINRPILKTAIPQSSVLNFLYSITNSSNAQLTIQGFSLSSQQRFALWATPPLGTGIKNGRAYYRKIAVMLPGDFGAGYDFTNDYINYFGESRSNVYIEVAVQGVKVNSGQRLPIQAGINFRVS